LFGTQRFDRLVRSWQRLSWRPALRRA
jgi:hypothetical protein